MDETPAPQSVDGSALQRTMRSRHLLMISLGGTIGTSLFMGAGEIIRTAGPGGALAAYLLGGVIMYMVLVCLGELAVAMPVAGSFQYYATRLISPGAGFATGWLYWFSWITCIAADITAAGMMMQRWVAQVPVWVWCCLFMLLLLAINWLSARIYGETEFWFAGIKIGAILSLLAAGIALLLGWIPAASPLPPLTGWGGADWHAVWLSMLIVVCSFQGTELVGIAAGECERPQETVPRTIRGIGIRIFLFYVATIAVLSVTVGADESSLLKNPFACLFGKAGIPHSEDFMAFVILTSALSAGSSALYACSRLLWSMAHDGLAPAWLAEVNQHGVPFRGVLATLAGASLTFLTYAFAPETVYMWLISSTGLTGCFIWCMIAWCHIRYRRQRAPQRAVYRAPGYPVLPWLAIATNLAVVSSLCWDSQQHGVLISSIVVAVVVYAYYYLRHERHRAARLLVRH